MKVDGKKPPLSGTEMQNQADKENEEDSETTETTIEATTEKTTESTESTIEVTTDNVTENTPQTENNSQPNSQNTSVTQNVNVPVSGNQFGSPLDLQRQLRGHPVERLFPVQLCDIVSHKVRNDLLKVVPTKPSVCNIHFL